MSNRIERITATVAKGLAAGAAGTAVMTCIQLLEMKASGRQPSKAPAQAVEKILAMEPRSERREQQLSQGVHWLYGSSWGVPRALMPLLGLRGAKATGVHLAMVWGTALAMLPSLKIAPPATQWSKKTLLKDLAMHAAYAAAAGAIADRLLHRTH